MKDESHSYFVHFHWYPVIPLCSISTSSGSPHGFKHCSRARASTIRFVAFRISLSVFSLLASRVKATYFSNNGQKAAQPSRGLRRRSEEVGL
jgi:hypothetical protein